MHRALILLLLGSSAFAAHRDAAQQDPVVLRVASSKTLAQPSIGFKGSAQCDERGDLFFDTGLLPNDSVVFKLLADGSHAVYGLTNDDARDNYYVAFRVDPRGELWLVTGESKTNKPVLFQFQDDPTTPQRTVLQVADGMEALDLRSFVELRSGHFLVQGFFGEKAPKKDQGKSYFAEFDSSGTLIRTLKEGDSGEFDATHWSAHSPAIEGDDGNLYFLGPDEIVVLSQAVTVVRRIKLVPPQDGYRPLEMYASAGQIEVTYYRTEEQATPAAQHKAREIETLYVLLDLATGRRLRVFRSTPELENTLVCFTGGDFIFYTVDAGRIKLLTAHAD